MKAIALVAAAFLAAFLNKKQSTTTPVPAGSVATGETVDGRKPFPTENLMPGTTDDYDPSIYKPKPQPDPFVPSSPAPWKRGVGVTPKQSTPDAGATPVPVVYTPTGINLGGVYQISPGVYETRDYLGQVISTATITESEVFITPVGLSSNPTIYHADHDSMFYWEQRNYFERVAKQS